MHFFGTKQARFHLIKVGWHKEHKQAFKVLTPSNNYYPSSLILYRYGTLSLTSCIHDTSAAIPARRLILIKIQNLCFKLFEVRGKVFGT